MLPRLLARRKIAVDRLARIIGLVTPRLAWVERLFHPRWPTPFQTTKRLTGVVMLLLGLTMISPVPFSHVLPALVIMLLALSYLEEDGITLLIALIAALGSLAITAVTVWGAVETVDWLDPARPGQRDRDSQAQPCRQPSDASRVQPATDRPVLAMSDIADRVSNVIVAKLRIAPDRVSEAADFIDDFAATSLDMVETVMALEDEFGIEISDQDAENLRTVGDVIALIRAKDALRQKQQ